MASKQFETYPQEIQNGITLHRAIDTFTDAHPVFRESTKVTFRYHHYAGVL
jgi:acyl carrier protein phosphodiesterase